MIIKFGSKDIETIIKQHIDELIYGVSDMKVLLTVPHDVEIICSINLKENK